MKVLAMYLPQFHEIPENDKWWGKGFTEWTAVKAASPLFPGHRQPSTPLDNNYYNLLEKQTMESQADLARKYDIDGMCFYHYYFKDGKKVLEKPAELLLSWKDIDMNYCFSWANESWIRSWSKVGAGNAWSPTFDTEPNGSDNGVLLKQEYGGIKEWEDHFYYLLQFFRDERYIRYEDMPVFVIHKPDDIRCLKEMKEIWNALCVKEGLKGIYFIGGAGGNNADCMNSILVNEPSDTLSRFYSSRYDNPYGLGNILDYEDVWSKLVSKSVPNTNACLEAFVGYDDTPRRGLYGTVISGATPEIYTKYLSKLVGKAKEIKSPFLFINAWNEWAEGMHLEPDFDTKFEYLEGTKEAINNPEKWCKSYDENDIKRDSVLLFENDTLKKEIIRQRSFWRILDAMLSLREANKSLGERLLQRGYEDVAIYGMGMVGNHLLKDLEDSKINVSYGIDQRGQIKGQDLKVYRIGDNLPSVDAIIVTVSYDYIAIKEKLHPYFSGPVISIEELLGL